MGKSLRPNKVEAIALVVAFIVMVAALMYDGNATSEYEDEGDSDTDQESSEPEIEFQLSGRVTDAAGAPVANASVNLIDVWGTQYSCGATDSDGYYEGGTFGFTNIHIETIRAYRFGYWAQRINLTVTNETKVLSVNFTLTPCQNCGIPVGPMVLATTMSGSTQVDISIYVDNTTGFLMKRQSNLDYYFTVPSIGGRYFNSSSTGRSLTYPAIVCVFFGDYCDTPGSLMNGEFGTDYRGDTDEPSCMNVTLDEDYLSAEDLEGNCTLCTLEQGESVTITAVPAYNYTLPKALWPTSTMNILGQNITITEDAIAIATATSTSYASVTLTALTPGTHTYNVYVESDMIIHVWEV